MGVPDDEAGRAAAAQGILPGTAGALRTELESLLDFQKRVNGLLDELEGSAAAPSRMRDDRMAPTTLGTPDFGEASGLFKAYEGVHDQLVTLSRLLSGQIGALSTAVGGSHNDYKDLDDDVARQMWAVQADLEKHYDPKRDPYADENKKHAGAGGGGDEKQQSSDGGTA